LTPVHRMEYCEGLRPVFTTRFAPKGEICPLGVNLAPRVKFVS
jgi:hypothetical protein